MKNIGFVNYLSSSHLIVIGETCGNSLSYTFEPPDLRYTIFTSHRSGKPRDLL